MLHSVLQRKGMKPFVVTIDIRSAIDQQPNNLSVVSTGTRVPQCSVDYFSAVSKGILLS